MEFRILGPLEVHDRSGAVRVPGAKERALLADLLVHAGRVVAADRLVEDLWGDTPPGNPANTLQGRVSALRRALGPAGAGLVVTSPPGYRLAVEPEQLDAARFQRLVAEADAAAPRDEPRAARLLEAALGLWRGPALAEFADRPWALAEAARLEELRLAAQEALAELRLAGGGHAELVGELEALVATQPLRERRRGQLMLALYRSGRQADALRVYGETRAILAEELGIDPSPELQRLQRAILTQDPAIAAPGRATAPAAPGHNLPERLTSLVGRDQELDEVGKLVGQHRLVTVTGPGGAGKTSLAVEAARRLAAGFPDGVWLVELAALGDPGLLAEAVAATLGLREEPGPPGTAPPALADRLAGYVRDQDLLVVLDNCEHLVAGCAELAARLLRGAPGLRVLATSREVLGVPGELVWPVPPLAVPGIAGQAGPGGSHGAVPGIAGQAGPGGSHWAVPDLGPGDDQGTAAALEVLAGYDGVRLFLERAQLADPGFVLDGDNAAAVAEICRRLDGLPLAIELAAARVRVLPAAELAARLEDRFGLLAGAGRAQDPRQRTLRATVDWSFQLLEEPDRRLFRRLSVFAGGWTVAAAEAVCGGDGLDAAEVTPGDAGGVLEGLVRLVDRSLVVAVGGDPARFRMLETLRAYGAERLAEAGEAELLAGRHTAWFVDLAEEAAAHYTRRRWIGQLEADYDNLRAAMDRAVAGGDYQTALRLGGALGWYWLEHHTDEGRQRLAGALALAEGQPPSVHLARALLSSAVVELQRFATLPEAAAAARRSLELFERFGDPVGVAAAKIHLGLAELQRSGPSGDAVRLVAEAEAGFVAAGDRWGEAYAALGSLTVTSYHQGVPGQAEQLGRRALERFEALDDQWGRALALFALANLAWARGEVDTAVGRYEQAIAAARQDGPLYILCAALVELGGLVAVQGDEERAVGLNAESAAIARRTGQRRGIAYAWNGLGAIARARGDLEHARRLHQEALGIVREILGWSVPHTLAQLGCAEARLGDLDDAEAHLREAAGLVLDAPQPATAALVLVGHALVALGRGRPERAALLLAAADATRDHAGVAPVGAEQVEADLARRAAKDQLDPDAYRSAQAAGRELGAEEALRLALG
jgi:predicted ATPase/DNA-binding SARP family transcriptional activator